MGLIKCPECGNEISDKAQSCPKCGYPLSEQKKDMIEGKGVSSQWDPNQLPQPVKRKGHGCLVPLIVVLIIFVLFCIGLSVGINDMQKHPEKYHTSTEESESMTAKYIDVTPEQGAAIDTVLNECGIDQLRSFERDEILDNAHMDGETGYRLAVSSSVDNIVLYLASDMSVYMIRYADNYLYQDGAVVATLQDYTMTTKEASTWMVQCEDKVKEVLKSPTTAKFPSITNWGFKKEKNIVTIQGYVDSQNSFGAEIRSEFQFIIDTNTNTIQSFIFDGQEMVQQ